MAKPSMSLIVIGAILLKVIIQVHKHNRGCLLQIIPLDLLCIDFTKDDPSRDSKENILVLTDAFTKFSHAFVTNNQKALTIAKILVDKWFYVYGIPAHIHSDRAKALKMP